MVSEHHRAAPEALWVGPFPFLVDACWAKCLPETWGWQGWALMAPFAQCSQTGRKAWAQAPLDQSLAQGEVLATESHKISG